ncbi:MAG: nickel pincer cofactor biosynthesis protein LarC [Planctomycetota bacterium]
MATAYFDCFSGAAGDMIVGALIDAGADIAALTSGLSTLGLTGYELAAVKVERHGLAATHFVVRLDESEEQPHRHLHHIVKIIQNGVLSESVTSRAIAIFRRLAEAEAAVHGTTIDKIHFHEVGAVDAILDIVGASLAMELLCIDKILCSAIPTGSGTIACAHGVMPVPAPATAELLKGVPMMASHESGELTTPTGAAILTEVSESFGVLPPMEIASIGYGAGTRQGSGLPNTVRVFVGDEEPQVGKDCITVLQTNIDDGSPEMIAFAMERLLDAGALDVYTVPIHMKKSRPGVLLSVLCTPAAAPNLERIMFEETPTFGIRRTLATRTILDRSVERLSTRFGEIGVKVGRYQGVETASPEFEDCRRAALEHGVPCREVIAEARMQWSKRSRE